MIIGSGGSGKSTLSRKLGQSTGLPVFHLDKYYWNPGWIETEHDEWIKKYNQLIMQKSWIIDGNYISTMDEGIKEADTVIFLDINRLICLYRVIKRIIKNFGKSREDMAQGCPEKIDFEFFKWVWTFPIHSRPQILEKLKLPSNKDKKIIILKNRKEVSEIFSTLGSICIDD